MEKQLFKRKRGQPLKHDFSSLKIGESVKFKGKARVNPYPYAAYWNARNEIKIEVLRDNSGIPYARRIL